MALARLSPFVTGTIRLEYALSLSGGLSIKHNKQIATRNHFSVVWKVVVTLLGGCGAPWNTLINTQAILSRSAHQTTALCVHGNSTCLPVSGGLTEIHTAASLCTVSATQQMAGGGHRSLLYRRLQWCLCVHPPGGLAEAGAQPKSLSGGILCWK